MTTPPRHTFHKAERLCSKKRIETLFAGGGRSLSAYPLRAVFIPAPDGTEPVQLLISVSKRRFKLAVHRNRTKRLIREAYRLNKHLLLNKLPPEQHLHLAFIWMSNQLSDFATVQASTRNLLQRIGEEVEKLRK